MKHTFSKVTTVITVIFLLNFISSCITDYCPSPTFFYFKKIRIQTVDKTETTGTLYDIVYTDTIRHQIAFEIQPTIEIAANETNDVGFGMNKAYGCEIGHALNPIISTKSKMCTNKPIHWNNEKIPAQSNLLEYEGFKDLIDFPEYLEYEGSALISIKKTQMKFSNEPYTFTFELVTSDDIILTDSVTIYIRI